MSQHKKYTIEVTEEQLNLISNACELSSRLRSGQFDNLRDILLDTIRTIRGDARTNFDWNHFNFETDYHFKGLKDLVDLDSNASYGIRESSETAKELYEIYYLIKHYFAERSSVYVSKLLVMTDKPKIKISEIEYEK